MEQGTISALYEEEQIWWGYMGNGVCVFTPRDELFTVGQAGLQPIQGSVAVTWLLQALKRFKHRQSGVHSSNFPVNSYDSCR